ncbi:site-specific integrase [Micromonospora sp. WMMD1082]|uniref:tyrosine-type recombinase/integrase n=1 Tax=Micromonospora sp. WMMD1082 TaxID=3016104 RepID=UPI002417B8BB|nr:site-specific integrase [Micromonospora sp. WMMD1082]MDG4795571.1 site-specific integrase [Micromonospora sp. WMMD1082]
MTTKPDRVATARALLAHLGLSAADLTSPGVFTVPTVADYLPAVVAAASPGTRCTYGSSWRRLAAALGDRRIDAVRTSDLEALMRQAITSARPHRNSRGGRHAGEHLIAAARAFYNRAIADGYLTAGDSPAHRIRKPRRLPNTRRALTPDELSDINSAARSGGNDIILDALLLRLHTETACRRGGALALRLIDLDTEHALIRLSEKGGTQRWQPITPMLASRLSDHAQARGAAAPTDALLRYRNSQPATYRRYDLLWARIGRQLPWVATQGVSTHWLRHTTLTWVERHFGYGIARAYAGHTDRRGPATTTYIKADLHAVATALAALTGRPHPLATSAPAVS